MKGVLVLLVTVLIFSFALPVIAGQEERYQAILLPGYSGGAAPILDTWEGHLWMLWIDNDLTYQGQVRPGKQLGDVVFSKKEGIPKRLIPLDE